jgi:hypothetical protein
VYDTHVTNAAPLLSDKYAFFRTTTNNGGLDQYQYGVRSNVNATFGSNGTADNLQDLQLHNDLLGIQSGIENVLNPIADIGERIGQLGLGVYNTFAHPIQTYTNAANSVVSVYNRASRGLEGAGFDTLDTRVAAFGAAAAYAAGSLVGGTQLLEGIVGQDFATGLQLSPLERWTTGLGGLSNLAFVGAGAVAGIGRLATEGAAIRAVTHTAADDLVLNSYRLGFVDDFVEGTVTSDQLNAVRLVAKGLPSLQREGFEGGLQFIDTGASVTKYYAGGHGIFLEAPEGAVPQGTLAEELQHAIDYAAGLHDQSAIAALKRAYGENFNVVWHQGVFNRIAEALEGEQTSIFHFFLDPAEAASFRRAATALGSRLK